MSVLYITEDVNIEREVVSLRLAKIEIYDHSRSSKNRGPMD